MIGGTSHTAAPGRSSATQGLGRWVPALVSFAISLLLLVWMALNPDDSVGAPVMVLFAPWTGRDAALGAAVAASPNLTVLRWGILPATLVVRAPEADLIERLHRVGAWAVLSAENRAGCAPVEGP